MILEIDTKGDCPFHIKITSLEDELSTDEAKYLIAKLQTILHRIKQQRKIKNHDNV